MRNKAATYIVILLSASQLILILLSWLITAAYPDKTVHSLLSSEGIRWYFGRFVDNLQTPVLVWLLLLGMAWGALDKCGIFHYQPSLYRHRLAMRLVIAEIALCIVVMLLLTAIPHAILLNVTGHLFPGSFSASIIPVLSFMAVVAGGSFGLLSGHYQGFSEFVDSLSEGLRHIAVLFVLYVLGAQLYASLHCVF